MSISPPAPITPAGRRSAITNAQSAIFLRANWISTPRSRERTWFPQDSSSLKGLVFQIQKVENGLAGQKPRVTFTVKDNSGAAIPLSSLNNLSLRDGRADDGLRLYQLRRGCDDARVCFRERYDGGAVRSRWRVHLHLHSRRARRRPRDVSRSAWRAGARRLCCRERLPRWMFSTAATTRWRISRWTARLSSPGAKSLKSQSCNQCHFDLTLHGSNRNDVEMCVLCHNPSNTDAAQRPNATDPAERTKPPQGINFNLLIHRIHTGENLKEAGKSYTVIGRNGSINDFTEVRFPAMSPQGSPGDTRNCAKCHVNESQSTSGGVNDVRDPQGFINPVKPNSSACIGCHVTAAASSHMLANTTTIGESCAVCHGSGDAFAVDKLHAQY